MTDRKKHKVPSSSAAASNGLNLAKRALPTSIEYRILDCLPLAEDVLNLMDCSRAARDMIHMYMAQLPKLTVPLLTKSTIRLMRLTSVYSRNLRSIDMQPASLLWREDPLGGWTEFPDAADMLQNRRTKDQRELLPPHFQYIVDALNWQVPWNQIKREMNRRWCRNWVVQMITANRSTLQCINIPEKVHNHDACLALATCLRLTSFSFRCGDDDVDAIVPILQSCKELQTLHLDLDMESDKIATAALTSGLRLTDLNLKIDEDAAFESLSMADWKLIGQQLRLHALRISTKLPECLANDLYRQLDTIGQQLHRLSKLETLELELRWDGREKVSDEVDEHDRVLLEAAYDLIDKKLLEIVDQGAVWQLPDQLRHMSLYTGFPRPVMRAKGLETLRLYDSKMDNKNWRLDRLDGLPGLQRLDTYGGFALGVSCLRQQHDFSSWPLTLEVVRLPRDALPPCFPRLIRLPSAKQLHITFSEHAIPSTRDIQLMLANMPLLEDVDIGASVSFMPWPSLQCAGQCPYFDDDQKQQKQQPLVLLPHLRKAKLRSVVDRTLLDCSSFPNLQSLTIQLRFSHEEIVLDRLLSKTCPRVEELTIFHACLRLTSANDKDHSVAAVLAAVCLAKHDANCVGPCHGPGTRQLCGLLPGESGH